MANASVAQRKANAVAKADTLTVDYFICPDKQTVIIASATTVGRMYTVTASECSCPAGRNELPCKHSAYRLHVLSPRKRQPMSDAAYAAACAAADDLF